MLVVGDSLEELTSPYLSRYLPGVELTINAVGGYNSYQIFDLFQESYEPSDDVIVFDAGTNDNPEYPEILAGNLAKVAETVGDRCMVVPTIHGFTVNGVDNTGKNQVVAEFAASRPGTQVPDWAADRRHPSRPDAGRQPAPDRRGGRLPRPADRPGRRRAASPTATRWRPRRPNRGPTSNRSPPSASCRRGRRR